MTVSAPLDTEIPGADGVLDTPGRRLLADLVPVPSPSGEESAAGSRLAAFFEDRGREVWVDDAGNVRAPGDDSVLLTSHVDTVPGDVPVRVEQGDEELGAAGPVLWGRGSVDATGPLAAMAVAAVETGASFVGVVGEETDSRGARYLIEDREAPETVINGEPSGWEAITLGYRGIVGGEYAASTPAGHGARPEANAIDHATAWWERVRAAVDDANGQAEPGGFDTITATAASVDGGLAADGSAVTASMATRFRVPASETPDSVRALVDDCLDAGEVAWGQSIPPHVASPRGVLPAALRKAIRDAGGEPTHLHKTGTADANLYADAWDVPVVTYGPGDAELDHAPDERLPLAEFDRAVTVLTTACAQLTD
ncbi:MULTISPECIES: [LysW]-lysine hydrolase [Halolamina]|uniref:Putative [LysW]-lysine/[LysW]-ornithine hydrolase n=1 Tax=Halolamina pelagica TaxID=699431 RepID=A0A1I5P424_9EURY|nr:MULTISPECIES: [LysW]-lysine hydrolase [Halolamina]NHX36608.1 [LysW]-lysine hydrolase [Halolamina sp. R1-12]SFP28590.1 acetylornithine deacetylase [Halolamina pelagica]